MASIIAFLAGLFEAIKTLGALIKLALPSASQKIDSDNKNLDEKLDESDKTGRP